MATVDYIYREFVCGVAFALIRLPEELNSVQMCAEEVLDCSPDLREQDFPESLRHEWRTIEEARQKLLIAKARSKDDYCEVPLLTATEAEKVLCAFLAISEEISRLNEAATYGSTCHSQLGSHTGVSSKR
jgi:hypothetical protein